MIEAIVHNPPVTNVPDIVGTARDKARGTITKLANRFESRIPGIRNAETPVTVLFDSTKPRKDRVVAGAIVAASAALANVVLTACQIPVGGGDAGGTGTPDGGTGNNPPATNPNPAYTGPSDQCWELYDSALQQGSVPEVDAPTLVECGDQNPGYFQQYEMPVVSDTGETVGSVIFGDRPPH